MEGRLRTGANFRAVIWFNGRNEHDRCDVCFESVDEEVQKGLQELHCMFVYSEKTYDGAGRRVVILHEEVRRGREEKYVKVVQAIYEDIVTAVWCAIRMTDGIKVKMTLHQGSSLSAFLFALEIDRLTGKIRQESP